MPKQILTPEERRKLELQVELKRRGVEADEGPGILEQIGEGVDVYSGAKAARGYIGKIAGVEPAAGQEVPGGMEFAEALGVSEEPVMDTLPGLPGELGKIEKKQFPPAEPMSKRQMAALGIEAVLDPTNLVPLGLVGKTIAKPLKSFAKSKSIKSIANVAKKSKLADVDLDLVGDVILKEDLTPLLGSPEKLVDRIQGRSFVLTEQIPANPEIAEFFTKADPVDLFSKKTGDGLIGKRADEVRNFIDELSKKAQPTSKKDIVNSISIEDTVKRLEDVSGIPFDIKEIQKTEDILAKYIKTGTDKKTLSLSEMQTLKQNIGKRLNDKIFLATPDKAVALEKQVLKDLYFKLKTTVENVADMTVDNGGKIIRGQNQRVKGLIDLAKTLEDIKIENLTKPQLTEIIAKFVGGAAIGGGLGLMTGSPYALQLGLVGGTIGAGKSGGEMFSRIATRGAARGAVGAYEALGSGALLQSGKIGARLGREGGPLETTPIPYRQPQSIPEQIVRTKLPRTTEGIMNNRAAVLSKVAQQSPEMLPMFKDIFDNDPEVVKDVISMATATMPHFFEPDTYDRFDNVVATHKMDLARMDLMRDPTLSNTDRIKLINELNKTSRMEYNPVKP